MENTTRSCLRQRSVKSDGGTEDKGALKDRCFIWKDRACFFSLSLWGELRGTQCFFLASETPVWLQLFAQWRENIQSFHPWLRHHGLDWPHSLLFSLLLSQSCAQVKWELHLTQSRQSNYEKFCIKIVFTQYTLLHFPGIPVQYFIYNDQQMRGTALSNKNKSPSSHVKEFDDGTIFHSERL